MIRTLVLLVLAAAAVAAAPLPQPSAVPRVPSDVAAPPEDAGRTASGLATKVIAAGSGGQMPMPDDVVTVHYTGWTSDGRMFDSSRTRGAPAMFPLNRALAGWGECVQLMTVGETRRCWVPQALAYRGQPGRPAGTIVFEIELLDTRRPPNVAPPDVAEPPADAVRTASGLAHKVLRPGTGVRRPQGWSRVTVHYVGWTTDGRMFDTSITSGAPATLQLDSVIEGWREGMQLMVEGERRRFWIPEELAYQGQADAPQGMLVFDVDLVRID